jgi:alpha-L-arabinofuranosidase
MFSQDRLGILVISFLLSLEGAFAQANLPIYTDQIVNGFQDWGWGTRNFSTTTPVHSGTNSITMSTPQSGGISFHQNDFDSSPYTNLSFWANGGNTGGQLLQVQADGISLSPYHIPGALPANNWQQYIVPLSAFGAANKSNVSRITIQWYGGTAGAFYLDEMQLTAKPAPALAHLGVDANQPVRSVDGRWFGVNTATWDGNLGNAATLSLLREMGALTLRWPGGSTSDGYHWTTDPTGNSRFQINATNLGAQVFTTVNYGSGSSNEAAAWVRSCNITNHCNFKYWEIGNENYGTWETDTNPAPNDPYTYAVRSAGYIQMMKAADPTIKIGLVAVTGEDSYVNNTAHPVINPRTGQTHNGWTPVMLANLKSLGVTPDFLIYHYYPEWTQPITPPPVADSDALLLQVASNWAHDAADLRQQLNDYLGTTASNVELVCTENNSDSSAAFGRQLTSLVNGLYLADSVCQLMKTEFNAYLWWDLRNGHNSTGTFDPTIYGWRTYGDEGMIDGVSGRYPTFYTEKLLQYFARPGDTVLRCSSDYLLLGAYAARSANGALNFLVINKDTTSNFTAQVNLANFLPASTALLRSYGIPQDDAVRTNAPVAAARDIATNSFGSASTSFAYSFPPLSLTLFTLAPASPTLAVLPPTPQPGGQLVLQLRGQSGVRYVLESSTDLAAWSPVATNTLSGSSRDFTNPVAAGAGQRFWRAVWKP